jgi:hypothetical protein
MEATTIVTRGATGICSALDANWQLPQNCVAAFWNFEGQQTALRVIHGENPNDSLLQT